MNNMLLLILFLIFLLIIFIYNNSNLKTEHYQPTDYPKSIDVRLCTEETKQYLIPPYDREFDLDQLKSIRSEDYEIELTNFYESQSFTKLPRIKTSIEDPYYHTSNIELFDKYESTKSDYSIINNIKLKENQSFVPRNYSLNIE
jgi:hypothetical protein